MYVFQKWKQLYKQCKFWSWIVRYRLVKFFKRRAYIAAVDPSVISFFMEFNCIIEKGIIGNIRSKMLV